MNYMNLIVNIILILSNYETAIKSRQPKSSTLKIEVLNNF